MTSPSSLSWTVKAGRLLRLFGRLTLAFALIIAVAVAIPVLAGRTAVGPEAAFALIFAIVVISLYLGVGAAVTRGRPWAKKAGVALGVLSLASFPFGTVIGAIALYYLYKGWNEVISAV